MARRMPISENFSRIGLASIALAAVACGSPPVVPQVPASAKLAESFVEAFDGDVFVGGAAVAKRVP